MESQNLLQVSRLIFYVHVRLITLEGFIKSQAYWLAVIKILWAAWFDHVWKAFLNYKELYFQIFCSSVKISCCPPAAISFLLVKHNFNWNISLKVWVVNSTVFKQLSSWKFLLTKLAPNAFLEGHIQSSVQVERHIVHRYIYM